jgi:hypothetical protein
MAAACKKKLSGLGSIAVDFNCLDSGPWLPYYLAIPKYLDGTIQWKLKP